jgi:hypothetical protein
MKKQQHIPIAIAIVACWVMFAIAFSFGKMKPIANEIQSGTVLPSDKHQADEIANPLSLKAISTFLLQ